MNDKKIIMYESPEAATYVTNIEGWVDINRRFFGKGEDGERMARYSSHTHKTCECGGKMEKGYTKCPECRRKSAIERYNALPFKEWDGKEPICTWDGDKYFFNEDDLIEHMTEDEDEPITEIDLLICDPVNFRHIDLETVADDTHEDWEPDKELCEKIDEFNTYLQTLPPHSWMPGKSKNKLQTLTTKLTNMEANKKPKDAMQKELSREIAAYERSVNPNYIAKKMVREYLMIIDRNWRKSGDPKVLKKAKKCASKAVDIILEYLKSVLDVKFSPRHEQDWELIVLYREVKSRIKNL